jgi:DNA-binding transcriptional MerR regulator
MKGAMRMRELEARSGVGRETIRFYIREGLLPEPARAARNSASYSEAHVTRLATIKRLQEERFLPLAVIRGLLDRDGVDGGGSDADRWLEPDAFPRRSPPPGAPPRRSTRQWRTRSLRSMRAGR